MKKLPDGTVKLTINGAGQVRIYPNVKIMKANGFRAHACGTFIIRQEDSKRFAYFTQLPDDDRRNDGKKHAGVYKIQHERGWTEFTIVLSKYVKERLVPVSKGIVDAWIVQPGVLRISLPHRFRKTKGAFAEPETIPALERPGWGKIRLPNPDKAFDASAVEDAIEYIDKFSSAERFAIRQALGWKKVKKHT